MTKGGKKRKGPTPSESQDDTGKYIPKFNKKHKPNYDSGEILERIQDNPDVPEPKQPLKGEKTAKVIKLGMFH